ncbi:hypothetical protein AGABI1DRAFT_125016 [Agaricus bisporus var. burnettii JB137-S8]|uniref:REJ domain-containing protein n=1 Tax=Agaricus bisporus var. burnettii (strain JB137-S8 / ATCC MYA-4627 / FGSC 10392) TaxID=597362 RepID=K5XGJ5_AGABU|nr:uncharacterized protein AGABI1DRAFT_125016 [Agaricus bisporus var. burnettii JB137-S8]EKM82553.1 hypothetical protein AGABI1DRAFT_125016 [Agaricus bisporus var. burnettii JB137-S8]
MTPSYSVSSNSATSTESTPHLNAPSPRSTPSSSTSSATVPTSGSSTASPSVLQSPSAPLTSSVSPTSPSSASQPSVHPNVGAIAGGTVGGFVVLASLGLIVFLWLSRRRRHRIAPSAAYRAAYGSTPPPIYPRVQSIPPGQAHHTHLPQASENFVVSSTRSTVFDGHRPSVAF